MSGMLSSVGLRFVEEYLTKRKVALPDWTQVYYDTVNVTTGFLNRLKDMQVHVTAPEVVAKIEKILAEAAALDGRAAYDKALPAYQLAYHHVNEYDKGQDTLRDHLNRFTVSDHVLTAEAVDLEKKIEDAKNLMATDPATDKDYGNAAKLLHEVTVEVNRLRQPRGAERAVVAKLWTTGVPTLDAIDKKLAALVKPDAGLQARAAAVRADVVALRTALDSKEVNAIATAHGGLTDLEKRLSDLETDTDKAATDNLRVMIPTNAGVTDAEVNMLLEVGKDNPDTMFAALSVLKDLDKDLNGAAVDHHNLEARALATANCKKELGKKAKAYDEKEAVALPLYDALDKATTALEAAKKEAATAEEAARAFHRDNQAALTDPAHADHARASAEYKKLYAAYEAEDAKVKAAGRDRDAKAQEFEPARLEAVEALIKKDEAQSAYDEAKQKESAAYTKRTLLDAMQFGVLSPGHAHQLKDPQAAGLVELFKTKPDIAAKALAIASKSENPENVLLCAQTVAKRMESRFEDNGGNQLPEDLSVDDYAEGLLKVSSVIPFEDVQKLDTYIASGRHLDDVPGIVPVFDVRKDPKNPKKKIVRIDKIASGKSSVDAVGARMVGPDGSMDLDAGRDAMLDVAFNIGGVYAGSVEQVRHMHETLEFFDTTPAAVQLVENAKVPQDKAGQALVFKATGRDDAFVVTDNDTRKALVTAMMTPVYQDKVGSCFVTASVVKMRKEDPMGTMQAMATLVDTGVYELPGGDPADPVDPVRAVQQLPEDENAVLRSFEYTLAQATSRLEDNRHQKELDQATARGLSKLKGALKPERADAILTDIQNAIMDAVEYKYFPNEVTKLAGDGSSSQGAFKLVDKMGGAPIESDKDFLKLVYRAVKARVGKDDVKKGLTVDKLLKAILTGSFIKQFQSDRGPAYRPHGGGYGDEAAQVLDGEEHTSKKLAGKVDKDTLDPAERTTDLLAGFLDLGGDGMVPVAVHQHVFNAVPDHPSMQALKGETPEETRANIQREVVDKAVTVRDTAMPLERVNYMFDNEMKRAVSRTSGRVKAALEKAWRDEVPTRAMTPPEFAAHLEQAMDPATDLAAQIKADQRQAKKTKKGQPMTQADVDAYKAESIAIQKERRKEELTVRMVADLGLPEIVMADTNWGSPEDHHMFVIVPDPISGTPKLCIRNDPEGELAQQRDADGWLADGWRNVA
ncbi:hypothetical protein ACERZ8_18920 [Tateyamaria armeniaca]|uniref:Uncharacterized protein n=1 Tax=Tateyamaria armeniaca TaxID=2518930 RepID=A0ABW8V1Q1_9RHOB